MRVQLLLLAVKFEKFCSMSSMRRQADLEHGHIPKGKVSETRDIEESDLVRAFLEVSVCKRDRHSEIAHILATPAFSHIILIPLRHYKVSLII